jgi:DNA invertase Pin-like site-specific DNA recombinase
MTTSYSGGSMERPALQKLLADIQERRIDIVVVYKVDRLTRSPSSSSCSPRMACLLFR